MKSGMVIVSYRQIDTDKKCSASFNVDDPCSYWIWIKVLEPKYFLSDPVLVGGGELWRIGPVVCGCGQTKLLLLSLCDAGIYTFHVCDWSTKLRYFVLIGRFSQLTHVRVCKQEKVTSLLLYEVGIGWLTEYPLRAVFAMG